ncbi:EAL domain-containing protein [Thiorhodovibrio frisius]|uniref:EAL domain-containing protein n=1 Tax=Thiorhodovibrio frisius TaxID=631362 RepID=H8Z6X1_9GAMM|nr:EAL domain-containing protein [Thiorhodovibrio frisius]EIC19756.1 EAL domain-containing protein [Thiorhodovibrio frisius]WPL20275.1 Blue light- and temperature-regulated antirepressor YcgF [Thiorhodovibrio frisius]
MACSGCEQLPVLPDGAGRLLLALPLAHSRQKLLESLKATAWVSRLELADLVMIECADGHLGELLTQLGDWLSLTEQAHTKALFLPEGKQADISLLAAVEPLSHWIGLARGQWLAEMIEQDRLTTHFQPIVHAAAPERAYAHECLLRGLDTQGNLVSPGALFDAARAADMLFHLDRAARLKAIETACQLGLETPIFINFTPTSIYDPAFCLRTTIATARATGWPPERFVFEVIETEELADTRDLVGILAEYRAAGFRVALDDLGAGYGSLTLLERLRPDIVKFDRDLITDIDRTPSKQAIVSGLIDMAAKLGIDTVGEGIERRAEWEWLREAGVDYLQGFLFARPGHPPPQPVTPAH